MTRVRDILLPPGLPAARVAACFGLVSDTHLPDRLAFLPPALFEALRGVDLLLHAGDVGELGVLDRLSAIAPVVAVHGNDETEEARRHLAYSQVVAVAGTRLLLTHGHYPDRAEELASRRGDAWEPKLARRVALGREAGATVVVFGHTHIPMAKAHDGVVLVNPGALASGNARSRQRRQTAALLYVRDDGAPFPVHVDLAAPAEPFVPRIDWAAGFRVALAQFEESIVSPELAADWPRLFALAESLPPAEARQLRAVVMRVAHRRWAGDPALITHADLLAELRADPHLPPAVRARFEAALKPGDGSGSGG
jgi:hypothetical protein